jgi:hypothetical protein
MELDHVQVTATRREPYWGIAPEPSLEFTVSSGMIITDHVLRKPPSPAPGGPDNVYGLCPCGSGEKWKFCCK